MEVVAAVLLGWFLWQLVKIVAAHKANSEIHKSWDNK